MQRTARPEGLDLPAPQLQRNLSSPNDRTPSISGSSLLSPPTVSPDPAYIAASAASQIVNSDRADRGHIPTGSSAGASDGDTAVVSPGSLVLINTFLDQLLFRFLASSRSTSIAALRPAILEVLKPRLGKEAVDGADEELQGYLSGGDAEELLAFHSGQDFKGEYNLNLVWRRTRLRCMVYTRLGDMEEEDEDTFLEQEQEADGSDGQPRLTRDLGSVSPAAAIFLTSILEFIGEQAILIASDAAYNRMQMKQVTPRSTRETVEEVDMEKLAFNTTLGRLWRSWKKRVRSSSLLSPRPTSRDLQRQRTSSLSQGDSASRKTSTSEDQGSGYFNATQNSSMAKAPNIDRESSVPVNPEKVVNLPEEPDFSGFSTGTPSPETKRARRGRPRSMTDYKRAPNDSPTRTPIESHSQSSKVLGLRDNEERPTQRRQRSSSLPARQTPYVSPVEETFTTPNERPDPFVRENDRSNAEKEMPKLTDDSRTVPDLADGDHAVSTMYDGAITQSNEEFPDTMAGRENRGIGTYTESSYADEYDHELTPQALSLHKAAESTPKKARDSQASGLSSNYSFLIGEQKPSVHSEGKARGFTGKENEVEEIASRKRDDSITEQSVDRERQHPGRSTGSSELQDYPRDINDANGRTGKRDSPVLYEATSNGNNVSSSRWAASSDLANGEVRIPAAVNQQLTGTAHGAPPLSPLRESMDAAHDTSYETSSTAPNYDTSKPDLFVPSHRPRASGNGSIASSKLSQSQSPMSANMIAEPRSQPSVINTGAGVEKAAVQRVSPSTRSVTGRTSTSSNRDGRPMTAASTTSQVSSKIKGMMGRDSGDLARQPMPDRNSSEGSGSLIRTPNKEQDFEELMKSDETVKYTLTPQNMREMESPDSPRYKNNARFETTEPAEFFRDSEPTNGDPNRPATSRSLTKLKGLNGLRSNPTNGASPTSLTSPTDSQTSLTETAKAPPGSVPRSPGPRSPGSLARDPTLKSDSVRDFADFIRSTGPRSVPKNLPKNLPPSRSPNLPDPVASNPIRTSRPGSSSSPSAAAGRAPPKKIATHSPGVAPKQPDAQLPKRTTSKLEAREPTVSNSNATADLADFFRSGPVGGQISSPSSSQQPRAAPQPQPGASSNGLSNGRMKEAVNSGISVASTQDSFAASKIEQSSTNSRTGLLESSNRTPPSSATLKTKNRQRAARTDDPPGPVRTQRRVRDQYALDIDSDNEDGYGAPQAPPEREEESLSDFLRDYRPPPEATTTRPPPIISGPPKSASKQTSPTIRERIARNIAVVPDYRPLPPRNPGKKASTSSRSPPSKSDEIRKSVRNAEAIRRQNSYEGYMPPNQQNVVRGGRTISTTNTNAVSNNAPPQLPPLNPRAMSPNLASQNGTKTDFYRPTQPTYAKPVDRGPRRQLQAREESGAFAGGGGPGLSDLADFLRETEPPAPSGPIASANSSARPMSPVREKEKTGAFGRMFGRR